MSLHSLKGHNSYLYHRNHAPRDNCNKVSLLSSRALDSNTNHDLSRLGCIPSRSHLMHRGASCRRRSRSCFIRNNMFTTKPRSLRGRHRHLGISSSTEFLSHTGIRKAALRPCLRRRSQFVNTGTNETNKVNIGPWKPGMPRSSAIHNTVKQKDNCALFTFCKSGRRRSPDDLYDARISLPRLRRIYQEISLPPVLLSFRTRRPSTRTELLSGGPSGYIPRPARPTLLLFSTTSMSLSASGDGLNRLDSANRVVTVRQRSC